MAANRVMESITSWLERKLFLKVNVTKTKIVRPMKSNFLGFTFWKGNKGWQCKPTKTSKSNLYSKLKEILKRRYAVARPLSKTFTKVNQVLRGWINYFRIGHMKSFLDNLGQWLRHKIRVIIIKQWNKPIRIFINSKRLNKIQGFSFKDEDFFKIANSRLGWYRKSRQNVVNFLLSPTILAIKKENRPGLVNPLEYYQR